MVPQWFACVAERGAGHNQRSHMAFGQQDKRTQNTRPILIRASISFLGGSKLLTLRFPTANGGSSGSDRVVTKDRIVEFLVAAQGHELQALTKTSVRTLQPTEFYCVVGLPCGELPTAS